MNRLAAKVRDRAEEDPDGVCAWVAEEVGDGLATMTNSQLWRKACLLAEGVERLLASQPLADDEAVGMRSRLVASDMGTCPQMLLLTVAAALGGFTVVALNTRLSGAEKRDRMAGLPVDDPGSVPVLRASDVDRIMERVQSERSQDGGDDGFEGDLGRAAGLDACDFRADTKGKHHESEQPGDKAAGSGRVPDDGSDERRCGFVMFTSGTTGHAKAAFLPWTSLLGAAEASNAYLNAPGEGVWQLTLPMFHVGGLQIALRSILNGSPFLMYARFHVERVLDDAKRLGATHVSVVNETLQRMMDQDHDGVMRGYECLLLGGAAPNPATLAAAAGRGLRVYTSYGMTETCSQAASCLVERDKDGDVPDVFALRPLPGYRLRVVDADPATRLGRLQVKGPGVFAGYLNAPSPFTEDGWLETGDTAREQDGRFVVAERAGDMFVSGGENVYPAEIRRTLLEATSASDAYVFGAKDARWGRRPVAFVEAPGKRAEDVLAAASGRLSKLNTPDHLFVLGSFPRHGIGKTDRRALKRMWEERLDVRRVEMWRVSQPLVRPMRTAKGVVRDRESLLMRVTDAAGRSGVGEDVAFSTDWYLPETVGQDERALKDKLIPIVLGREFLCPEDVDAAFEEEGAGAGLPLARAALENAMWDLYGKTTGKALAQLMAERVQTSEDAPATVPDSVAGGVVLGVMAPDEACDQVRRAVAAGYGRVKLKVRPGQDVATVRAVRRAFPDVTLVVDANQSYDEDDPAHMRALVQMDEAGVACIEEPLVVKHVAAVRASGAGKVGTASPTPATSQASGADLGASNSLFDRLDALQQRLRMRVFLDESWHDAGQLEAALESHEHLRGVVMKLGKFGGIAPALRFYKRARAHDVEMWVGGMYDYGVSKGVHAAFSALPGCVLPGDLSDTARYFAHDVCDPPFSLQHGRVPLEANALGLGRGLDMGQVRSIMRKNWEFTAR